MTGTRLQVVLARAGVASRRACEKLILAGAVRVNGKVITELGTRVEDDDAIIVKGRPLERAQEHRYVLLNKPREVVTTVSDPEGRRTVMDFVPGLRARAWPVGRLDYQSEGLVLITNDGQLTHDLTHPSRHVPRVYQAKIDGELGEDAQARLRRGVRLRGRATGPIEARPLRRARHSEGHSWIEVIVHEGRYHLVREALALVGHPVSRLKRVAFGPLTLGRVPAGAIRELRPAEVRALRQASRPREARAPESAGAERRTRPPRPSRPARKGTTRR